MGVFDILFGIVFCTLAGIFCYGAIHINEERRKNKYIPLPWEKGGYFDKSKVKTTDGDNT